jgi:hypothetical protein
VATDEDARTAARRIVEQVLSSRAPATAASGSTALADEVVDDVVIELTGELDVVDPVAVVEDAVEDVAADADVAVDDIDASDPRARARALVAEVLAAHAARSTGTGAGAEPDDADAPEPVAGDPDLLFDQHHRPSPAGPADPPAETTSRLRARELVAEALAAAEERELAARAEEEAREAEARAAAEAAARAEDEAAAEREREREAARRIEEARRAEEARAEAERVRQEAIERERREEAERLERERERAAAEARERELWAEADRDVAAETTPLDVRAGDDRTAPLSVAELAATGHPDDVTDDDPDDDPDRTALLARDDAGATAFVRQDRTDVVAPDHTDLGPADHLGPADLGPADHLGPADDRPADAGDRAPAATGTLALPREDLAGATEARGAVDRRTVDHGAAERGAAGVDAVDREAEASPPADPRVLEAVVDLDAPLPPARGGRWLLVSVIGAITLAIVFPLAIRALLQLVSLS